MSLLLIPQGAFGKPQKDLECEIYIQWEERIVKLMVGFC